MRAWVGVHWSVWRCWRVAAQLGAIGEHMQPHARCRHCHPTNRNASCNRCTRRYYIVRSLLCTCVCCMKACMLAMRCRLHCLPLYSFHALLSLQHPGLFSRPCSFPLPVPIRNLYAYFSTLGRLGRDSILANH